MTVSARMNHSGHTNLRVTESPALFTEGECDQMFVRMIKNSQVKLKSQPKTGCFGSEKCRASNRAQSPVRRQKHRARVHVASLAMEQAVSATENGRYILFYKSFASAGAKVVEQSSSLKELVIQGQMILASAVEGAVCHIKDIETGESIQQFRKMSTS